LQTRILLVDDSEDIQDALAMVFGEVGYVFKGVQHVIDLEKIILDFKPDVILLDIWLGSTDGKLICKFLKNHGPTKRIPICILSAGIEREPIDCGQDALVEKPFEIDYLKSVVDKLADKNQTKQSVS